MKLNASFDQESYKRSKAFENFSYPESNNICFMLFTNLNLLFTCIIGYFSYLYSTDSYYFGKSEECISLRSWVYAFSCYCFIIISKEILLLMISIFVYFKIFFISGYCLLVSQFIFFMISTLVSVVLNIGITIILTKNEPCGSCRKLAIFLAIFYWIVIIFVYSLMMCYCRYCGFSTLKNSIMAIYANKNNEI